MKKGKRYMILILAVTVLAAAGSYLAARLRYEPVYQTKATLAVIRLENDSVYENLPAAITQGQAFAEVLNSPVMRKTVLSHLAVESFEGTITAAVLPDTNLLELEVTDSSPGLAYLVINGLLEAHQAITRQVIGEVCFEVLQMPQVPVTPINESPAVGKMVRTACLTALVMAVLCAWHFFARNPVPGKEKETGPDLDLLVLMSDAVHLAKRFWKLGILLVLLSALAAVAWRWVRYQPVYEASVSFTVRLMDPDSGEMADYDAKTADKMADIFQTIMTSDVLGSIVQENLALSELPDIRMSVGSASKIMTLTVTDSDPEWAYEVLTAVLSCYPEVAEYAVGPTQLLILDSSGIPEEPNVPFKILDGLQTGALTGAALWIASAAVLALLKHTLPEEKKQLRCLHSIDA